MTSPTPGGNPLFSHRTDEEPVDYPAHGQDDAELNAPFSAPETPNPR